MIWITAFKYFADLAMRFLFCEYKVFNILFANVVHGCKNLVTYRKRHEVPLTDWYM